MFRGQVLRAQFKLQCGQPLLLHTELRVPCMEDDAIDYFGCVENGSIDGCMLRACVQEAWQHQLPVQYRQSSLLSVHSTWCLTGNMMTATCFTSRQMTHRLGGGDG